MDGESFVRAVETRLTHSTPGLRAQLRLAPDPRPGTQAFPDVPSDCLRAGVLVLLYPSGGRLHVLLTRRTPGLLIWPPGLIRKCSMVSIPVH